MPEEPDETTEPAASDDYIMDTDMRSALAEVVAIAGAQAGEAYAHEEVTHDVEWSPIALLANTILQSAVKEGASHIHVEPDRRYIRVRFRIDGVLHEVMQMPAYIKQSLTQRYKIIAGVNIIKFRISQAGEIGVRYGGSNYNLRADFLPTQYGEKIVIGIANAQGPRYALNQIGLTPEAQTRLEDLLYWRRSLLIIAGGHGQGKTTTQYVLLNTLNTVEANTFAVSDRYEYTPPGITQAQLNPRIGYTAEAALKSIADLDADNVAIDQPHSRGTLPTALQMAASGVLTLFTLDAADAVSALRLLRNEADSELLTENLSGILAQVLVRKICPNCKEYYAVPASDLRRFGYHAQDLSEQVQLARGAGCEQCRNTGYKGRIGLFELLTLNDEVAGIVSRGAKRADLKEAAKANGMKELHEDGLAKILQGITTPQEVLRAVFISSP